MPYVDKEKQRAYQRDWLKRNRPRNNEAVAAFRGLLREAINLDKEWKGCCVCGIREAAVLDYHHTDPSGKAGTIGMMVRTHSVEAIQFEIDKCVVICADDHRRLHNAG